MSCLITLFDTIREVWPGLYSICPWFCWRRGVGGHVCVTHFKLMKWEQLYKQERQKGSKFQRCSKESLFAETTSLYREVRLSLPLCTGANKGCMNAAECKSNAWESWWALGWNDLAQTISGGYLTAELWDWLVCRRLENKDEIEEDLNKWRSSGDHGLVDLALVRL